MMAEFEQNIATMGMKLETYLENIKKTKRKSQKAGKKPPKRE